MKNITTLFLVLIIILIIFVSITTISARTSRQYFRVFVTNESFDGNVGGITGADKICKQLAHSAALSGNWKAWLSNSHISASKRLFHSPVPYVLLNGEIVAYNWSDLIAKKENEKYLWHAINTNQFGEIIETSNVMTGTLPSGNAYSNESRFFCMDFQSNCSNLKAWCVISFGTSSYTNHDWTHTEHENCREKYHLYCFEQP